MTMRFYKIVSGGYLLSVGTSGYGGIEITQEEYDGLLKIIKTAPTAPVGYAYRLTESLEWELIEVETPDISEEATAEDYQAALSEMGVQV